MANRLFRSIALTLFNALLIFSAYAEPIEKESLPDALKSWVPWALHGEEDQQCPFFYNTGEMRQCSWPARLNLNLTDKGGTFTLEVSAFRKVWVPLPGDAKHWPQDVKVDGKPASVTVAEEGASAPRSAPSVKLSPGTHTIAGTFLWNDLPENLPVPNTIGLVALTLNGAAVASPRLDEASRLWLKQAASGDASAERIELRMNRLVNDDIPMMVTTRIEVVASGKTQEVVLSNALLAGFIPLSLSSQLPARVERDGSVRVQVRPGRWQITLTGRNMAPLKTLTLPKVESVIAVPEEVWAFQARNDLRLVTVEGVPAVDPQQTTLPAEWKAFPAFRVQPGDVMKLNETKRGDPEPAPDRLALNRQLWLDFDGGGYTMQDRITGSVTRAWRLEMAKPQSLGRAAIDSEDQYITELAGVTDGRVGIELRRGKANIVADSRLAPATMSFSATGWAQDFNSLSANLHLPPGWQLLHAAGVDRAPGSWVERWSLLDFFLVLIVTLACGKLFGWRWALVALAGLMLSFHEAGAPRWLWLNLLAALALLRVLPAGKPQRIVAGYRWVSLLAVLLMLVPFAVDQVRHVLYPVLERPWMQVGTSGNGLAASFNRPAETKIVEAPPVPEVQVESPQPSVAMKELRADKIDVTGASIKQAPIDNSYSIQKQIARVNQIDPKAKVQTGPGLPAWQWNDYQLIWSGPVEAKQQISLWFVSPVVNGVLTVLRLVLLVLLLARIADVVMRWPRFGSGATKSASAAAAMLLVLSVAGVNSRPLHAADMPTPEILKELKGKLLLPPECLPQCAAISRMNISAGGTSLQIRIEASAAADTAIPLPGAANQWLPDRVVVDGKPAQGLLRDAAGSLWVQLAKGVHQISLESALNRRDTIQLPLPLKPYRVEANLNGWTLDGLAEDGTPGESLMLSRAEKDPSRAGAAENTADNLPPFVRVERTLLLGITWEVNTRVTRASASTAPLLVEIPLMAGESVTNSDVRVQETGGQRSALVNLGPQSKEFSFDTSLREAPQLTLKAPTQTNQIHTWRLNLGSQWHATLSGIPVIHQVDSAAQWLPQWQPWPGEEVKLALTKPRGVDGQTLTLDRSMMEVSPGIRATDAKLQLSLRASRGGQHVVQLPEAAVLQAVNINGQSQPIRLEGRELRLPIVPGSQDIAVTWREPRGVNAFFESPIANAGTPGVNGTITIKMPQDRWALFVGGTRVGPAVLFWGAVIVLIFIAVALGKMSQSLSLTPLKWHHWLLLGLGLTQAPLAASAVIVGWFIALGLRKRFTDRFAGNGVFNFAQIVLVLWTLLALLGLFWAVQNGLLGYPEMQIGGNGSSSFSMNWYQDRTEATLPTAWVISVPLLVYRLLMLAWALWLAYALLKWLGWAWECYSDHGYWRKLKLTKPAKSENAAVMPE